MAGFYAQLEQETSAARKKFMNIPLMRQMLDLPRKGGSAPEGLAEMYVRFLEESFHHVRAAPRVYALAGSRVQDNEGIQEWLTRHAIDEFGHHRWILNDLKTLGVDTRQLETSRPSPACDALLGYMYYVAGMGNPLALLGDSFVIEGLSQLFATSIAKTLQGSLGLGSEAVAYLAHHGELDESHMQEFESVVNKNVTSKQDLADIIHCANVEFELYGRILERVQQESACLAA